MHPLAVCAVVVGFTLPGGFTDPDHQTGFFATPDGGIDAVALATGDVLWHTTQAQRPLFVHGDRLYALGLVKNKQPLRYLGVTWYTPPPDKYGFCIRAYDLNDDGKPVLESTVVELPEWVSLQEMAGQAFVTRFQIEKDGFVLTWEARSWFAGAKKPAPDVLATSRKHAEGSLRVNFETGDIADAPPLKAAPPALAAWPFAKELENLALRWQGVSGGSYKALIVEETGGKEKLVLHSWDRATHTAQGAKELAQGKSLIVLATVDERYLCVREALPSPDQTITADVRKRCDWTVFAVDTGERVGGLPFEVGQQTVTILDGRAYVQVGGLIAGLPTETLRQPRTLRVLDLKSGKVLWERPIPGKPVVPRPT